MARYLFRRYKEIEDIYMRHFDTVYRIAFTYMKNPSETEDVVQETFFRLIKNNPVFENEDHEKAWLIRTAANICKNHLKHWWRKRENLEDFCNLPAPDTFEIDEVFKAVSDLPEKYKTIVYLYYYEGYNSVEIAKMQKKPESTIRTYLKKARLILKERLGNTFNEE